MTCKGTTINDREGAEKIEEKNSEGHSPGKKNFKCLPEEKKFTSDIFSAPRSLMVDR